MAISKQNNIKKLTGGISVKDNPDKLDKNDFDANKRNEDEMIEEDEEDEEEVIENEEGEGEEAEDEAEEGEEIEEEKEEKEEQEASEDGEDEGCLYQITKKKPNIEIELDAGEDNFEDDENDKNKSIKSIYVKSEDRVTKPFLFEFERVRILGERARQLSLGAKPMLKNIDNFDPKLIAKMELEQKVIPLIILRELPDGRIEKWKVNELIY